MKSAFTMIELIFVIVILGILAAVALPKFMSVGQQAHESNLKSWVGTLNRSVGPTLWAESLKQGKNGDISSLATTEDSNWLKGYTDIPKEVKADSIDFTKCNDTTADESVIEADKAKTGTDYYLYVTCRDGNAVTAPIFKLYKCTEHVGVGYNLAGNNSCTKVK